MTAESDLFVVMHVDRARGVAQLMERSGKHRLFDVSFGRLRILNHTLAQAIHRILELSEQTRKLERSPEYDEQTA